MLPSWRDRLHIALCPDRLVLLRMQRGLRPRLGAKQVMSCDAGQGWECALAALAGETAKPEWQNADVTLILSNHFVHYLLAPWSDQLSNDEEQTALVQHCYSEVYGAAVADWELRWSADLPGAPWLASAVERPLLERLRGLLQQNGLRLHSVQPYLMAAFNRWRKEFNGERQWFVLGEPGRLCVAQIQGGSWRSIRSHRITGEWKNEAALILEREMLLAEDALPQEILLQAPEELGSIGSIARPIRQLQPGALAGLSAVDEKHYAMLLGGVS